MKLRLVCSGYSGLCSACRAWRALPRSRTAYLKDRKRYLADIRARKLGIRGWCHNHPDDSVEGAAAGPPDAIQQLCVLHGQLTSSKAFLAKGPQMAQVDNFDVKEQKNASETEISKVLGSGKEFEVRRYR